MSAIAGIFNLEGRPADCAQLRRMTDAVAHRGPDGVGHWIEGPVGLGHLQLRTTPEAANERQPLALNNGNWVITWDGRLDNREELIGALRQTDPVGEATPDAELALRAYRTWGADCVRHILGDFAFGIWDQRKQQLFCARDPIGVRVLHYYYDGRKFLFGTEIKELLADPGVPRVLNDARIAVELTVTQVDLEETFYQGIYRLPGGYSLLVTPQGMQKQVYWAPDPADRLELASDAEYEEQFLNLFQQSVKSRLRSPGPVGVLLSGGVDSSAVHCTAETLRLEKGNTLPELQFISSVFPEDSRLDESHHIREVVELYGTPGQYLPSDELWGMKPVYDRQVPRDEPFAMPYEARSREFFRRAQDSGIRVLLDGLGGDEVLHSWNLYLMDLFRGFRWWSLGKELRYFTRAGKVKVALQGLASLVPWQLSRLGARFWNPLNPPWIDSGFAQRVELPALLRRLDPPPKYRSLYLEHQHCLTELRGRRPALLWSDAVAAEFSIERRHPFWDVRLLEFLIKIPPRQKYKDRYTKSVLRRAMRNIMPETVRTRRDKTSLAPLFDLGVGQREAGRLAQVLEDPLLARAGYVDAPKLREALRRVDTADHAGKETLFVALTLEEWLQQNLTGNGARHTGSLHHDERLFRDEEAKL